jgi:UDP-glucose 4-epimerase
LAALDYLEKKGESITLNCGYNKGYSVKEVIQSFERLHGKKLPVLEGPRRPGDVPFLVANSEKISKHLKWSVKFNDLPTILNSAWSWEQKNHITFSP